MSSTEFTLYMGQVVNQFNASTKLLEDIEDDNYDLTFNDWFIELNKWLLTTGTGSIGIKEEQEES